MYIFQMVYVIKYLRNCIPLHGYHCANGAVKNGYMFRSPSQQTLSLKCEDFILNRCMVTSTNLHYMCYIVKYLLRLVRTALKYVVVIKNKMFLFRDSKG